MVKKIDFHIHTVSSHKDYDFSYQQRMDEQHSAVRFCTCWATKEEDVSALINKIKELTGN